MAFDEGFYLENYSDVKAAVEAKVFSSGLEHFQLFGAAEDRNLTSPFFDENLYLQRYGDVAEAVSNGVFASGLTHFIEFGSAEGRSGSAFNEKAYLWFYPDVGQAVSSGMFSSGLDHYTKFGQFEPNRYALFNGSSGNDIIAGFGTSSAIAGVGLDVAVTGGIINFKVQSLGVGEIDTLIGGAGADTFLLSVPANSENVIPQPLYVGNGSADYAVIRKFDIGNDEIVLAGRESNYRLEVANGNTNIFTSSGDLIGVVEGVSSLNALEVNSVAGAVTLLSG
ncbi:hypothetical protein H6S82_15165 [Planktothrix sp. FACHB-1355]|uniref:Calcium-binding protein n=1 Tax=Aerosakkonema funiforme FACHB-1375 TaxID=2949571 RepID=A0A926ZGG2_9CYAN|nr:hypothetical protein [Aerosakkonema funiforme FACHB-1375]MBD3560184.1 hypothetical protein [Planktothrix sp. FACHB-1355]